MIKIIVNNNRENRNLNIGPIWLDDTASMIKQKLTEGLKCSTEEMYLYLEVSTMISPDSVYSILSKNKKTGVSTKVLMNYCENIRGSRRIINEIKELEKETGEDKVPYEFIERIFSREQVINVPFGVSFSVDPLNTRTSNIFMTANPYDAKNIKSNQFVVLSTNEETLLSKLPNFYSEAVLVVCTAKEAIGSMDVSVNIREFVSLYFPKLSTKLPKRLETDPTSTVSDYLENLGILKNDLLKQSESLFKTNSKYYQNINYWNTQIEEVPNLENNSVGITSFTATYLSTPTLAWPLPMDFIFKSIHATEKMPFIRYVISKRREQMIRLYAPEEAEEDKRIPYLSRSLVNKIITKSKKTPGIGVFVATQGSPDIYLFLELKENGEIQVQFEAPDNKPITPIQMNFVAEVITEFVAIVSEILKQTDITFITVTDIINQMTITNVDWIYPFQILNPKEIFSQSKAKLGSSVFLPETIMTKEQGKREKESGPAKTKEKANKLKTEMSFVYTRISNFSVDMPEELQTTLRVFYSVDSHLLYMKVSNIPIIKYLQSLPKYVFTFVGFLTDKNLEEEYKSAAVISTYGYHKQKGEQELEAKLFEEMKQKDSESKELGEMEEEEEDELQKFIKERMIEIPKSIEKEEDEEDLGEFDLKEVEAESKEEAEAEEDEELGDFDEELGDFDEEL
jgi:hypothetical protein